MKKRDLLLSQISSHPGLLACPLCRGALAAEGAALRCPAGHSFDAASSGYVNLLAKPVKADYTAALFEARRHVCAAGFFNALLDEIVALVCRYADGTGASELVLLDVGCGEGSHLARVAGALGTPAGVGVDISKEGVRIAAREHPGFLWLVGDLARLPLADGSVDVILNVLSPSNYAEFNRVLKPGGLLVKAAPGEGYLWELRQALYGGADRERYSNEKVLNHFKSRFQALETREVSGAIPVPAGLWPHVVAMTPLGWGAGEERVRTLADRPMGEVTLSFTVLAGRKTATI